MKPQQLNPKCHVIRHPVVLHKLAILRDKNTSSLSFRLIVEEISQFLAYSVTESLEMKKIKIATPLQTTEVEVVSESLLIVPIMRAGNGMLNGVLRILPFASVGHIGIYRDKFINNTVEYYFRLPPDVSKKRVIVLDPILASGDTACAALDRLKDYGVGSITLVTLISSPEGLQKMREFHPDVDIYTVSVEKGLDSHGYVLPGLGDAGDRLYGETHWK